MKIFILHKKCSISSKINFDYFSILKFTRYVDSYFYTGKESVKYSHLFMHGYTKREIYAMITYQIQFYHIRGMFSPNAEVIKGSLKANDNLRDHILKFLNKETKYNEISNITQKM